MAEKEYQKILFRLYSTILEEITVETMWATMVDESKGLYKLENIPFYLPLIAANDIVFAEYDADEQMLTYRETREYSGHSTIHVVLIDKEADIKDVGKIFEQLGCNWEGMGKTYLAMDVPAALDYRLVQAKLIELKEKDIIDFAESSLSDGHYDQ